MRRISWYAIHIFDCFWEKLQGLNFGVNLNARIFKPLQVTGQVSEWNITAKFHQNLLNTLTYGKGVDKQTSPLRDHLADFV
jgi:hypothetical protein